MNQFLIVLCFIAMFANFGLALNLNLNHLKSRINHVKSNDVDFEAATRCLDRLDNETAICYDNIAPHWTEGVDPNDPDAMLRAGCCASYEIFGCIADSSWVKCDKHEQDSLRQLLNLAAEELSNTDCRDYPSNSYQCFRGNSTQPSSSTSGYDPNPDVIVVQKLVVKELIIQNIRLSIGGIDIDLKVNADKDD